MFSPTLNLFNDLGLVANQIIYKFGLFSEYLEKAVGWFLKDFEAHLLGRTRFPGPIDGGDAQNVATRGETLK